MRVLTRLWPGRSGDSRYGPYPPLRPASSMPRARRESWSGGLDHLARSLVLFDSLDP